MKSRFLACTAVITLLLFGAVRAEEPTEVKRLKAQTQALKKQHDALEKRLGKLEREQAVQIAQPAPDAFVASVTKDPLTALTDGGPIAWHGITVFGVLDGGVSWQSHGTPNNGAYPQGLEYAIARNSNRAGFGAAPGGLGYSGIGLKGEEEILPGLAGVFAANTQFNPFSGQLGNGPASLVQNNGVALNAQSSNGDSARAGQAFNDYLYAGLSSRDYGALTFGRQRTLTTDDRAIYDPIPGSLAFSLLGYTGALSSGDTENSRFGNSLKYVVNLGQTHFGAIYKLGGPGTGANTDYGPSYQLSAGFDYAALSFDAVFSHVSDAISLSSLSAAQVVTLPTNSLAGTVSDNSAVLLSAKYTFNQFKFFGGYEYIDYKDPKNLLIAPFTDSNGYVVSSINTTAYSFHDKILQLFWTGVKYSYDAHLDLSAGYYHELQNSYGRIGCNYAANNKVVTNAATCSGTEDALGVVAEYHFNKRFEIYGGLMLSVVTGGMANGFLYANSVDPTIGLRTTF